MDIKIIKDVTVEGGDLVVKYGSDKDLNGATAVFSIPDKTKKGGFGSVLTNGKYALKIIPEKSDFSRESFEREVNAFKELHDLPNFIRCHACGETNNEKIIKFLKCPYKKVYFILMDRVQHELDEWIKTLETEEDVRVLFRQICDRVLRMNIKGFIHRDLKPGNIMFDTNEEGVRVVKLIDFGLAKEGEEISRIQGTPAYIAPEIYGHKDKSSPKSCPLADIWSLGIVLLYILAKMKNKDFKEIIPEELRDSKYAVHKGENDVLPMIPVLHANIRGSFSEVEFPNCLKLLVRLLAKKEERIQIKELGTDPWLKLNVEDIVCGHFKIKADSTLRSGSFGSVYQGVDIGTDSHTGQEVAIKRIAQEDELSQEEMFEKYSQAEIASLEKLRGHPNILEILGHERVEEETEDGKIEPAYYIVTEWCAGHLHECNPGGKIPKECIQQLCNALIYMNVEKGMVHRDVKPENIMYAERDGKKITKLIDFGFAKKVDIATSMCGTYGYKAPELYTKSTASKADKADIYSLGKTLEFYGNKGLLPDDFPREVIEGMTKMDYEERMSWDELKSVDYLDYKGDLPKKVGLLLEYADDKFCGSVFSPDEMYGLYYAVYMVCLREALDGDYVGRCVEKLNCIAEICVDKAEVSPDAVLLREALKNAREWVNAGNEVERKRIKERIDVLLNRNFYLNPDDFTYKDIRDKVNKGTTKTKIKN